MTPNGGAERRLAVITGAFSYTGGAVARELSTRGWGLRTLTNRSVPLEGAPTAEVDVHPLQFHDEEGLERALQGARLLVNTYWVRYPYIGVSFDDAVGNTERLLEAAKRAGVERVVHVSVSNASPSSPLGYYKGKAVVEELVRGCGLSWGIVRPTLVVGVEDILVNDIAWFLRRFPVFAMPGSGRYRLQPVTLEDVGRIVADVALASDDVVVDAAGREVFTFEGFVRAIAAAMGVKRRIAHFPSSLVLAVLRAMGWLVNDVILTAEELAGLTDELLLSHEPPRGTSSVREWLEAHGERLGRRYVSERRRHPPNRPMGDR